jgi:type I restriction enzyme R subunit
VRKYQNRAIKTAQVIEELIQLAKDMRAANAGGEPTLVKIARELVETVKKNVTIDRTMCENVRARLRVIVKRILRKYGYPPDKQEKATQTVLEQAEVLSEI